VPKYGTKAEFLGKMPFLGKAAADDTISRAEKLAIANEMAERRGERI
jgi:hypothetical protein